MAFSRPRVPSVAVLLMGLVLGWGMANVGQPRMRASGGDRSGESIVTTGPVAITYDEGTKLQIPQDALYYLDYKRGRLLGTIPTFRQTVGTTRYIDRFAERDLVADFKIDLDNGPRPHFIMTTGTLGNYAAGWAPLYVVETSTNQLAVYRIHQQAVGTNTVPKFELVELRPVGGTDLRTPRP